MILPVATSPKSINEGVLKYGIPYETIIQRELMVIQLRWNKAEGGFVNIEITLQELSFYTGPRPYI